MKKRTLAIVAILSTAGTAACGRSYPTPPGGSGGSGPPLAGTYTATKWTTTDASGPTNQLLAGSTMTITLNAIGTTSGHLHVVSSGGNPPFDADMTGTWTLLGGTVRFAQTADTFVRDMGFGVVANGDKSALEGDQTFSETRVQLTLTHS
jgi:hypothetical protein